MIYRLALILYKIYWPIKLKSRSVLAPVKNKLLLPLINRYVVHAMLGVITLAVATNNLQANVINQNFGQGTLLYALYGQSEFEETVVESDLNNINQPVSYFKSNAVSTLLHPEEDRPQLVQLAAIASGGSALVKPNLGSEAASPQNRLRDDIEEYEVQEGDTISSIAEDFGVSVNTILWENKLTARSLIRPGQKLKILPTSGVAHTVTRGESLGKISRKYNIDEDDILAFNEITDPSKIVVGTKLIIPEGRPQFSPAPISSRPIARVTDIFKTLPGGGGSGQLAWPTAGRYITQYYTWRHGGLDIDGNFSSPIYASEAGVVETAGWHAGGYGIQVLVNHGNGVKTRYAHLSKLLVVPGHQVGRGEVLGIMGSTGRSTGSHLHYEIILNGVRQNPLAYIR